MANNKTCLADRKNLPRLICFSGIDGSGKTTLAKTVVENGRKIGIDYKYVWANAQPILIQPLRWISNRTFLRGQDMFRDYNSYKSTKLTIVRKNLIIRWMYISVLLLDYFIWLMIRVNLPRMFGRNIVLDRYIFDVAINTGLLLERPVRTIYSWTKIILYFFPKPDLLFWVDVPEEEAFERKNDIPSMEYLHERRKIYAELMQRWEPILVDGTQNADDLLAYVWGNLGNC